MTNTEHVGAANAHALVNCESIQLSTELMSICGSSAGAAMAALNHRLLRLEDVAMGSWIQFVGQDKGWQVILRPERGFNFSGCRGGDVVSHYITPKAMLCMAKQRREQCCTEYGEPRGARQYRRAEPNMGIPMP